MRQMEMVFRMQEIENKVRDKQVMMQVMQQTKLSHQEEEDRLLQEAIEMSKHLR